MGKCRDCEFWEYMTGSRELGVCRRLFIGGRAIFRCGNNGDLATTWPDFGCVYFKGEQRGPFKVHMVPPGLSFGVYHQDRPGVYIYIFPKAGAYHAERMADLLNDLWAQRETCDTRTCQNCRHYEANMCYCGSREFVCHRWSQNETS